MNHLQEYRLLLREFSYFCVINFFQTSWLSLIYCTSFVETPNSSSGTDIFPVKLLSAFSSWIYILSLQFEDLSNLIDLKLSEDDSSSKLNCCSSKQVSTETPTAQPVILSVRMFSKIRDHETEKHSLCRHPPCHVVWSLLCNGRIHRQISP